MIAPISGRQRQRNAFIHKKSVVHRGDGCHDLSKYKSFEIKAYCDFFNRLQESPAPADGPKRIENRTKSTAGTIYELYNNNRKTHVAGATRPGISKLIQQMTEEE